MKILRVLFVLAILSLSMADELPPRAEALLDSIPDDPAAYRIWKMRFLEAANEGSFSSFAPVVMAPMVLTTHNGYVRADVNETTGVFEEGADPSGGGSFVKLTYSFGRTWHTEWVMYWVDSVWAKTGTSWPPSMPPASSVRKVGDTIFAIWNNWRGVRIKQMVYPVSLGRARGDLEQIEFKAVLKSADRDTHRVGLIVYYDTMLRNNDAAPIATAFGFTGIASIFFASRPPGIPPIWHAYERGFPPAPADIVATGILTGFDAAARPPDVFWYGSWPASVGNRWQDSDWIADTGSPFGDSATMVKWYPVLLAPGDSVVFVTYYGIGEVDLGTTVSHSPPEFEPDCENVIPNPFEVSAIVTNGNPHSLTDVRIILDLGASGATVVSGVNPVVIDTFFGYGGTRIVNWDVLIPDSLFGDTLRYNIVLLSNEDTVVEHYQSYVPPDIPMVQFDSLWFFEETDCDGRNVVHVCYDATTCRDKFVHLDFGVSFDGGRTWHLPAYDKLENWRHHIGDSVTTGVHCFDWNLSDDVPGVELDSAVISISYHKFGTGDSALFTTFADFARGDTSHVKILSPDPDGLDDGALWLPPGRDTIYVLQVYPDGHCRDCMSRAIYSYMGAGHPPLKIKIYIIPISQFNAACAGFTPGSDVDSVFVNASYIDTARVVHPAVRMRLTDFDVLAFGVADSYGNRDLSAAAADAVAAFAKKGRGLLLTHDTSGCSPGCCMTNFCSLTEVTGIACTLTSSWTTFSIVHRVADDTLFVLHHPFNIPDTFSVLLCHWKGQRIVSGTMLYQGTGIPSCPNDNLLYWQAYHNLRYNSFSSFYSYGHRESVPMEWEAKAMINSIYYSYHGGVGSGVYVSEPFPLEGELGVEADFSADVPVGANIIIEVALDTCIGPDVCWTDWYRVGSVPSFSFDQVKYRVGMTLNEENESPILHWLKIKPRVTDPREIQVVGALDSRAPRISWHCPDSIVLFGDTLDINFSVSDMFVNAAEPGTILIDYCEGVDTIIARGPVSWVVTPTPCDSARMRILMPDSFCNWGALECVFPIVVAGEIHIFIPETIAAAGETINVPIVIDSMYLPITSRFILDINVNSDVIKPMDYISAVTPAPATATLTGHLDDWRIDISWSTRVTLVGDTLGYLKVLVDPKAVGGSYSPIYIDDFTSDLMHTYWESGIVVVAYSGRPWLQTLVFDCPSDKSVSEKWLTFGVSSGATDLYDPRLDLLWLPSAPTEISAWFAMDDPSHPAVTRLSRDIKDIVPVNIWQVVVSFTREVRVRWNPSSFGEGIYMLNDEVDMKAESVYFAAANETLTITWSEPELVAARIPVTRGWNLLSLPVRNPTADPKIVFHRLLGPFEFNPITRSFQYASRVSSGIGYWTYSWQDLEFIVAGEPVAGFVLPVYMGWNLIGAPYSTVPVDSIRAIGTSILSIYGWDGSSYFVPSSLEPGKGYWVLVPADGELEIRGR